MGVFDVVKDFAQQATPAGWLGLYDGLDPVDYGSFYGEQSALYREELTRRSKQFAANDVLNANAVAVNLLVGGNKSVGTSGAAGVNFQKLQDEFAAGVKNTSAADARAGSNLAGLQGDSIDNQKRINAEVIKQDDARIREMIGNLDLVFEIGI